MPEVSEQFSAAELALTMSSIGEGKWYFSKAFPIGFDKAFKADFEAQRSEVDIAETFMADGEEARRYVFDWRQRACQHNGNTGDDPALEWPA